MVVAEVSDGQILLGAQAQHVPANRYAGKAARPLLADLGLVNNVPLLATGVLDAPEQLVFVAGRRADEVLVQLLLTDPVLGLSHGLERLADDVVIVVSRARRAEADILLDVALASAAGEQDLPAGLAMEIGI